MMLLYSCKRHCERLPAIKYGDQPAVLPIVTVGVGFGIDYALYIVSRAVEGHKATWKKRCAWVLPLLARQ
jgi:hypothetical protein